MLKQIAVVALSAWLLSGCYLGRSPERKTLAILTNTAFVGVGLAGVASANGDEAEIATMLAAIPLVAGLVGLAINLAVDSTPTSSSRSASPPPPPPLASY